MSNYNIGDIIQLTRQSIGMSQEELSDGICSVQTLSRIENGKVSVKKNTYQQLMERMGRNGQKNYSVLKVEEFDVLEVMRETQNLIFRKEYTEAEKQLDKLKKVLDLKEVINIQYIMRKEAVIRYRKGYISKEEYLKELEKTISLSISDYRQYIDKIYPFTAEEVSTLMNIASAYGELEKNEIAISIYNMLLNSLNTGYMEKNKAIPFTLILIHGAARMHGGEGRYQIAIQMCWNAIHISKQYHLFTILPNAYGEISWNMMKQIEKGEREEKEKEEVKKIMRQGYAAAALSKQHVIGDVIKNQYYKYFDEDIYASSNPE